MHKLLLTKPDGRSLTLYGRAPIEAPDQAPSPFSEPLGTSAHLRWHPLRGEWVTYAAYRQDRTFLPPPEYNPLAPTTDPAHPTEVPAGRWDIAVFENRFPSLGPSEQAVAPPQLIVPTARAEGQCEVVVFTQDPKSSLSALPPDHVDLLLQAWGDRTRLLGAREEIRYVLPFENRGAEVGVTLHHPHGQIYAYPVIPPVPQRMLDVAREHVARHGRGPLQALVEAELAAGERLLYEGPHALAFVPVCARYPYEVWITTREPVAGFAELAPPVRRDLARALLTVLRKYDGLWQRPFPYLMAWYQAPTDGQAHPGFQLHAQVWPPYRTRDRLKYLAGTEIAAGFFAMDALPEAKAAELRAVAVELD
ncbi:MULTISPECIES: galactose-1-phosphate uridylyltransferase [Ramlibacter]|uniref:Galactose-1-phosphate uridylyltransferase n=1 Tax=Ramlibacter aquaticus TaxID=2780094 RepID=A0ABR9SDX7_9BURK|nr:MULTISPECIES: galactose-1-phosphate uridylyltransferase [Ramlibacter]MBE7940553.1 galactose-1-phosphate uridylyltransferase [Ramlibacter aquaticus]